MAVVLFCPHISELAAKIRPIRISSLKRMLARNAMTTRNLILVENSNRSLLLLGFDDEHPRELVLSSGWCRV